MADPGFPRREGGGAKFQGLGTNVLFNQMFPENYMKMKEFGPGGGVHVVPPLDPPLNIVYPKPIIHQKNSFFHDVEVN